MGVSRVIQGWFVGGRPRPHVQGGSQLRSTGTAIRLPDTVDVTRSVHGRPLPPALQAQMEETFGAGFSDIRVHVGAQAQRLGAYAFTLGSQLHFAPGQWNPDSAHGRRLLAHELTHVIQQRAGRVRNPFGSGVAVVQDPGLEAEAERMALRVSAMPAPARAAPPAPHSAPPSQSAPVRPPGPSRSPGTAILRSPAPGGRVPAPHVLAVIQPQAGGGVSIQPSTFSKGFKEEEMELSEWGSGFNTFASVYLKTGGTSLQSGGKTKNVSSSGTSKHAEDVVVEQALPELAQSGDLSTVSTNHLVLSINRSPCTSTNYHGLGTTSNKTTGCAEVLKALVTNGLSYNSQTYPISLELICERLYGRSSKQRAASYFALQDLGTAGVQWSVTRDDARDITGVVKEISKYDF